MKLKIKKKTVETEIVLGKTVFSAEFCDQVRREGNKIALFCDGSLPFGENLLAFLQKNGLNAELFLLPPGERAKTRETKQALEDLLLGKKYGKDSLFLALGGGAATDFVAFLASTYLRGVPLILIPTTLLAMVDAAIGGKTAVDTPFGKNLIGTLYLPKAVWMDLDFLKTLPKKEWLCGLAEVLKMGLISDQKIWKEIEEKGFDPTNQTALVRLIERAASAKIRVVEADPEEHSLRAILNFGHTVGHAIELASGFTWPHGMAVAVGCVAESYLSCLLGHLLESDLQRIIRLIQSLGYPLGPLPDFLFEPMQRDKKAKQGKIRFVLLKKIGEVFSAQNLYTHAVDEPMIKEMLRWLVHLGK